MRQIHVQFRTLDAIKPACMMGQGCTTVFVIRQLFLIPIIGRAHIQAQKPDTVWNLIGTFSANYSFFAGFSSTSMIIIIVVVISCIIIFLSTLYVYFKRQKKSVSDGIDAAPPFVIEQPASGWNDSIAATSSQPSDLAYASININATVPAENSSSNAWDEYYIGNAPSQGLYDYEVLTSKPPQHNNWKPEEYDTSSSAQYYSIPYTATTHESEM